MRTPIAALALLLALGACRASLGMRPPTATRSAPQPDAGSTPAPEKPPADAAPETTPAQPSEDGLGRAAQGSPESTPPTADAAAQDGTAAPPFDGLDGLGLGPGGFVARGSRRSFYAGRGGRLWYYMNLYYWVSETAPLDDLWIKAEVVEQFTDLKTWPDGKPAKGPEPKVTLEYWEVGPTRRSTRLDNHRDYFLLEDQYTAGAITVEVTLTLGKLEVQDKRGDWGRSKQGYVLISRNYSGGGGLGPERSRFVPLQTEAVTVWRYRVPWDVHPQRLTRSKWRSLRPPSWAKPERRFPPRPADAAGPVLTPRAEDGDR
ncbi:MAG: hypothetical protein P1V36_13355 [Planctomycetota bacterium]|nr:hypothetical protein [Planctomycetota bacterium]